MTLTTRVLLGLIAGTLLGLAIAGSTTPLAGSTLHLLAVVGGIFVDLIRMTAMPLVAALVVSSIGATTASGLGRTGVRSTALAVTLLVVASAGSMLVALPVLRSVPTDPAALVAPSTTAPVAASQPPPLSQWVRDLVPQNVAKAAADGAMLPVIVFSVLFGLAGARITPLRRDAVLRVVEGVAEAMQQLVSWILQLAPIGVFALAVPLTSRLGLAAAGAVATYVALVVALTVLAIALLYPLGMVAGRMSARAFASYCAPAQALAFASRSSLATLPAMVQAAERAGLAPAASRVVLPLAVSIFHYGTAVAQTVGVLFLARLSGVTFGPAELASVVFAVVLASSAVPGVPGGSIVAIVPVLTAAGLPLDGIGLLLAVDTVPDMFRTIANVTGALTLTAATRSERPQP
ncbi:MAG: dicarboxylate/amino acid:cation symporter [Acidobacteriota bacterium]